ncbi:MAG: putative FAD-linked oxidoreductase [Capsulimonas sp.]|nr:putative FAD-linked oxidoreductase [Capsulimonas sp.]
MTNGSFDLFGRAPAATAAPSTIADVQEIVREAPKGAAIVPWGGGTRQHLGYAPERYDLALSTQNLNRVVDYQPADMTVTVEAGITVAALQTLLGEQGQFLPLDVAQPKLRTVGGIIAVRADSLRRLQYGSVRDSLIGVSVIDARAELIKGGGRVVKNVSGYDLPKMYCGSLGTLGLIVEASFKVSPLPQTSATVLLPLEAEHNSEDVLDSLLASELVPSFLYLLSPQAARVLLEMPDGVEPSQMLVVGFDGDEESVAWQVETLGAGALDAGSAGTIRERLRDFAHVPSPMTCAFHILSSQVGAFSRMLEWTARRAGFTAQVATDAALGMMWAHFLPASETSDWNALWPDLFDKASRCGGSFIVERMPDELRVQDKPIWFPLLSDFALMQGLKETLDPGRLWNPGRFVGRL